MNNFPHEEQVLHHVMMYSKVSLLKQALNQVNEQDESKLSFQIALIGIYLSIGDMNQVNCRLDKVLKICSSSSSSFTREDELLLQAIQFWLKGEFTNAMNIHTTLFQLYPRNVFSFYFGYLQSIFAYDMKWLYENMRDYIIPAFKDDESDPFVLRFGHYLKAYYCFAMEELNMFKEAEEMGHEAEKHFDRFLETIDVAERHKFYEPWTHHGLCHIYHTQARYDEGIVYMESKRHTWHSCNSFLQTHNYWHLALLYIARNGNGDVNRALDLLSKHIWIEHSFDEQESEEKWKLDPSVQYNAINMLWKLDQKKAKETTELFDLSSESIWKEISEGAKLWTDKHLLAFHDINYAYLLVRDAARGCIDHESLNEFKQSLEKHAQQSPIGYVYTNLIVPLTEALDLYVRGDVTSAYNLIEPIFTQEQTEENLGRPSLRHNAIGGSLLQREVLDVFWLLVSNKK
jgi:hypothetical protein